MQNVAAMIDYIVAVSSPVPERFGPFPVPPDKHDRLHAMYTLKQRLPKMPTLYRESVPMVPLALDLPKHLAVIASTIVRNARDPRYTAQTASIRLSEFSQACFDVETMALHNVKRLAPPGSILHSTKGKSPRPPRSSSSAAGTVSGVSNPIEISTAISTAAAPSSSSPASPGMTFRRSTTIDSLSSEIARYEALNLLKCSRLCTGRGRSSLACKRILKCQ